ncbi:hypothetical protein LPE509_p00061 (plasmid) [Legionella pneumophila subsp. pneumophila LPE509]|nr:hypothetical protein LPE509_p00061 [Legionella pneumophila subsp. pneumophila LPE509]
MSNILNIKNQFTPSICNCKTLLSGFLYGAPNPQIHLNPIPKKSTGN